MKIGILSLIPFENFCGIMQSFVLQTILEREGHEVSIITKWKGFEPLGYKAIYKYPSRLFLRICHNINRLSK